MTNSSQQQTLNRRKILSLAAAAAVLGTAYFVGIRPRLQGGYTLKHSRTMMGTIVTFTIIGDDRESCQAALEETAAHMERQGFAINSYDENSPLSRLNRNGILRDAPETLLKVTRMSIEMSELTGGAFDPTVYPLLGLYRKMKDEGRLPPRAEIEKLLSLVGYQNVEIDGTTIRYAKPGMAMTLDGLGKGYIVDEGVRKINELGFGNVCIEAGGDLMVTGTKESGEPWTIAIRSPRPDNSSEQILVRLENRAIATSGDYMQYFSEDRLNHHIINPATGFSPPELASCSIIAPSVARADGLATSAMVLGHEKTLALLDRLPGCEGFLVGKDLSTHSTDHFFN